MENRLNTLFIPVKYGTNKNYQFKKMNKFIVTLLLACMSCVIHGQYTPMVDEEHTWKITNYGLIVMQYQETISGDSIIEGVTYKKHWTQTEGYPAYLYGVLREDVENQRVYVNFGGGDQLLYDFTLEVGEQAEVYGVGMMHTITVSEVSTVIVGGQSRKKITYTETEGWGGYWIEGIGSNHGIMDAALGFVMDFNPMVNCFYEGNDLAWTNPENTDVECDEFLSTEEFEIQEAVFYPNPAHDRVRFQFPAGSVHKVYRIVLYDVAGRVAFDGNSVQSEITLLNMASGLYAVQIFEGDRLRAFARVTVE